MTEIAQLGFSVSTGELEKGRAALEAMVPAAERASKASVALAQASLGNARAQLAVVQATEGATKADIAAADMAVKKANAVLAATRAELSHMNAVNLAAAGMSKEGNAARDAAAGIAAQGAAAEAAVGKLNRLGAAANDNINRMQSTPANIAAQFQDVGVTAAAGMSPFIIALQQGTQLSAAFAGGLGGIGGALKQMFSPLSLVTIAAVALIAYLIQLGMEYFNVGKKADEGAKIQRDYVEVLGDAKTSMNDLTKAAQDYANQQKKTNELTLDAAGNEAKLSAERLNGALALRIQLQAQLEADNRRIANLGSSPADMATMARFGSAAQQSAAINKAIDDNRKNITALTIAAGAATNKVAGLVAMLRADPSKMVAEGFDQQRQAVNNLNISYDEKIKRLTEIDKAERLVAEATRHHTRAVQEYGREIDLAQAKSIAQGAGFNVTSGLRTRAEQQWLYDHKRTAENPVALPGTSAHEKGRALDIGFGPGVTVESIKKAYDDMGVHLTKVLRETGHFHIEWATTTADRAAREHEAAAKRIQDAYDKAFAEIRDQIDQDLQAQSDLMAYQTSQQTIAAGNADLAGVFPSVGSKEMAAQRIKDVNDLAAAMKNLQDIVGKTDLGDGFGKFGSAIDDMASSLERMTKAHEAYIDVLTKDGATSKDIADAKKLDQQGQLNGQIALLHGAKSMFSQQSAAYKALDAMEKIAMARSLVSTAVHVAAGAAKIFGHLGPWAFPVVAEMIGVMASLGFSGSSSAQVAPPTAQELQDAAGTGSVLGDGKAKSNSIANSLDIVASNTNSQLEYSNEMLASLRSIETNISKLAGNVARQIGVSGSMFDTSKLNLGSSGSSGFLGLFASSTSRTLWDSGLKLVGSTVGSIVASGVQGSTYQIVQQIKKNSGFLGIGGGTKTTYETTTGSIDPSINSAIQDVVISLRNGLLAAANVFGIEGAAAIIDNFKVEIGTLSFKDMTGAQIEEQLNAIFSKVGDDMAGAILPSLVNIQQVGEGLFETFTRAAREYQVVDTSLESIGLKFGMVGVASIEARDRLVQLLGGLDKFTSATTFYHDNFLTDAQKMAPVMQSVSDEMDRLNLSGVDTIDKFKGIVDGLDLTTEAGASLYAALMNVAPAFSAVEKYQQKLIDDANALAAAQAKTTTTNDNLMVQLLTAQGHNDLATALKRMIDLNAITDDSTRSLTMQLYAAQDAAQKLSAAHDTLMTSYQRERGVLVGLSGDMHNLAASLLAVRQSIYANDNAKSITSVQSALASGDSSAASSAVSAYLSNARDSASSLVDFQRQMGVVASLVDGAIGNANSAAAGYDAQITLMDKQVGSLTDISNGVVSLKDAIDSYSALIVPPATEMVDLEREAAAAAAEFQKTMLDVTQAQTENAKASFQRLIELAAKLDTFLQRVEGDGIIVKGDPDQPVYTKAA
jgi:hypothetical protein